MEAQGFVHQPRSHFLRAPGADSCVAQESFSLALLTRSTTAMLLTLIPTCSPTACLFLASATVSRCAWIPQLSLLLFLDSCSSPRPQEIGQTFGATVQASDHREYGEAIITILKQPEGSSPHMDKLFEGIEGDTPVRFS